MDTLTQPRATFTLQTRNLLRVWMPILLFSLLWMDLVRLLSGNWEAREQYAYGWFVPFLALALLWRRWLDRPSPDPMVGNVLFIGIVALAAFVILPLRVVFEINTDWPLIAWAYTSIAVGLTLCAFLLAGGWAWVRHFAFPICFIMVALVWPYRVEKGLTQSLMQVVASLTVEIIGWFGIPALQRGNLIEVTTGVVGVDEACSGIRSFQSTLMAALFLGELYRLSWFRRLLLVVGGVILSFAFNVVRTLFLTWQASAHGISAIDKWHDTAGMSIFLVSFACLWAFAVRIQRKSNLAATPTTLHPNRREGQSEVPTASVPDRRPPAADPGLLLSNSAIRTSRSPFRIYLLAVGCWAILCVVATELWYRAHDKPDSGLFDWTVALPENKVTYQKIDLPPRTLRLLSFDEGTSGKWTEDGIEWSTHFFRWKPRSIQSVITSRVHRPEVCLTAAGLRQVSESELVWLDAAQLKLPFRKYIFEGEGSRLYVFFCQWESGNEQQTGLAGSKQAGRLQAVLKGRRMLGQQTLEIILTGCENLERAEMELRNRLPQFIEPSTIRKTGLLESDSPSMASH